VLRSNDEYPIYAVEITNDCIGIGGGREGGFVGVPVFLYNVQGAKTNGPPVTRLLKANDATEQQTSCKHSDSQKEGAADSKPSADNTKKETKSPPEEEIKIHSSTTEEAKKPELSEVSASHEAKES
jgi:hypothetical protein